MGIKYSRGYCHECDRKTKIQKQTPNHILHLLLMIVTFGVWGIAWLLLCLDSKSWICSYCGEKV